MNSGTEITILMNVQYTGIRYDEKYIEVLLLKIIKEFIVRKN